MPAKKILSAVLLFFLAVSLGAWGTKLVRKDRRSPPQQKPAAEIGDKVIVYYFHGHARCESCVNTEKFAKEAVETGFEKELADGTLQWRVVDFDIPANRHFDIEYGLGGTPGVVLVHEKNGKSEACELLRTAGKTMTAETRPDFIEYLQQNLRGFLKDYGYSSPPQPDNEKQPQTYTWGLLWALWLGIFTAITPCTLVSNIAAVSYIGRRVDSSRQIIASGLLYAIGQTLAYTALGFVLVAGLLASSTVSSFLHRYMHELLGPLLVLTAMFLLGMIGIGVSGPGMSERLQNRVAAAGVWGAFVLGILFALTFCPVSGALFFFQLVPSAILLHSPLAMPALYGFGNAFPVVVFAFLLAFGTQSVGKAFNRLAQIERWLRWTTGGIFLAAGIFFTLRYVFDLAL